MLQLAISIIDVAQAIAPKPVPAPASDISDDEDDTSSVEPAPTYTAFRQSLDTVKRYLASKQGAEHMLAMACNIEDSICAQMAQQRKLTDYVFH